MDAKDLTLRLQEPKTISVSDLKFGDILEFERTLGPFTYYHCGKYAGNKMVIHKGTAYWLSIWQALDAKRKHDIKYRIDRIEDVANGSKVYRNNMLDEVISRPSEKVLKLRAMALFGDADYNPFFNNCQHFCTYVRYGITFSRQTDISTIWTTITSTKYDYTKEMVQVLFDDDDLNLARRDGISKSFIENKRFDSSVENQMPRKITSSSESKPQKEVPILSTCITGILFLTKTSLTITNTYEKRLVSSTPSCNSKGLEKDISTQMNIYMLLISILTVYIIFRKVFLVKKIKMLKSAKNTLIEKDCCSLWFNEHVYDGRGQCKLQSI